MTVTLSSTPMEIYRRVPSVSVLTLPRFLDEFDGQLERLENFRIDLPKTEPKKAEKNRKASGSR
jgi:hypothetical protein